MKVSILTSGFPNGFTEEFIQCIKKYYDSNGVFVFIASDFNMHSKTDKYINVFINMFNEYNITFKKVYCIDSRVTKEEAQHHIEKADIVWISGGDTLKQIKHINEYDLISDLQNREGITIGMSAGSINMAKKVILAKDIEDNIPELSIYEGIGLVDINIEPHLNGATEEHINEIYKAAQYADIYGIHDNSFIMVVDNNIDIYGTYFKYQCKIVAKNEML